jgi:hypothetical protein
MKTTVIILNMTTVEQDNEIFELKNAPSECCFNEEQFEQLWDMRPDDKQFCVIFGKKIEVPRKYSIYGSSYNFAGVKNSGIEVPTILEPFLQFGNSILVNYYNDGSNYIGYHSDNEKGLVGLVYGFSYGASRNFKFQNKKTKEVTNVILESNSLIIMKEHAQRDYKHSLPASKKIKDRRISITIRTIENAENNDKKEEVACVDDPLISFEASKQLTHTELDKFSLYKRGVEVNMNELQVGDYIETHTKYRSIYGRISRKTNKTIFLKKIINSNANLSLHYDKKINDHNDISYDYYYVNIHTEDNLSTDETKIAIKPEKIYKAIDNFIVIKEFDWGR